MFSGDMSWTETVPTGGGQPAFDSVAGLILLLFLRWLTAATLLPHARVNEEIVRDRNVNVSLIEGVFAVGIAAIILLLF